MRHIFSVATMLISFFALLASIASAQSSEVIGSPGFLDFGRLSHDTSPQRRSIAFTYTGFDGECLAEITAVNVIKGAGFYSAALPANPIMSPNSPTRVVTVTATPSKSGVYNKVLEVEYIEHCTEKTSKIDIVLNGEILCTNATENCDPVGPLCTVDNNQQPITKFVVGTSDPSNDPLVGAILQPLLKIRREHHATLGSYTLRAQEVLGVSGIGAFIDINPKCCIQCDDSCPGDIIMTRVPYSDKIAEFIWKNKQDLVFNEDPSISGFYNVQMNFPKITTGRMILTPVGAELHFNSPHPKLEFDTSANPIFHGEISCLKGSLIDGVIRQLSPGTSMPDLDLLVVGE